MDATVLKQNQPATLLSGPDSVGDTVFVLQFDDSRWYLPGHNERIVLGVFLEREDAKKCGTAYLESRLEDRKETKAGRDIEANLGLYGPVLTKPRAWEIDVGAGGVDKACVSDGFHTIFVKVYAIPFYRSKEDYAKQVDQQ